jgi:hypothetical protein
VLSCVATQQRETLTLNKLHLYHTQEILLKGEAARRFLGPWYPNSCACLREFTYPWIRTAEVGSGAVLTAVSSRRKDTQGEHETLGNVYSSEDLSYMLWRCELCEWYPVSHFVMGAVVLRATLQQQLLWEFVTRHSVRKNNDVIVWSCAFRNSAGTAAILTGTWEILS